MHFETIIFLLIAFNVVAAALKRRARKAAKLRDPDPQATRPEGNAPVTTVAAKSAADDLRRASTDAGKSAPPAAKKPEPSQASLGKDLLDQLAQELGLKIPTPVSAPTPQARNPETPPTAQPAPRAQPAAPAAPATPVAPVLPLPAVPTAVAVSTAQTYAIVPRRFAAGLRDTRSLREAIVLKEILDRPVALRRN